MTKLEQQAAIIEQQAQQIQLLEEKVEYLMKKLFGKSSEKSSNINEGQMSIFGDTSPFFPRQSQLKKKPTKKR